MGMYDHDDFLSDDLSVEHMKGHKTKEKKQSWSKDTDDFGGY